MPSEQETFAKIEEAVRAVLDTDKGEVEPSSLLIEDLGLESIDFLDLGYELEKRFGGEVDLWGLQRALGEDVHDFRIQDIVRHLRDGRE
jgi:acyl carrier protein